MPVHLAVSPYATVVAAGQAAGQVAAGSPCSPGGVAVMAASGFLLGLGRRSALGAAALTAGGLVVAEVVAANVTERHAPTRPDSLRVCAGAFAVGMGMWAVGRALAG
jgi:hypothetical protein